MFNTCNNNLFQTSHSSKQTVTFNTIYTQPELILNVELSSIELSQKVTMTCRNTSQVAENTVQLLLKNNVFTGLQKPMESPFEVRINGVHDAYTCYLKTQMYKITSHWSAPVQITALLPEPILSSDINNVPAGDSVTLTCNSSYTGNKGITLHHPHPSSIDSTQHTDTILAVFLIHNFQNHNVGEYTCKTSVGDETSSESNTIEINMM